MKTKIGGFIMLPCPFCGKQGTIEEVWQPEEMKDKVRPAYTVGCPNIKCKGLSMYGVEFKFIRDEVVKWNKRI